MNRFFSILLLLISVNLYSQTDIPFAAFFSNVDNVSAGPSSTFDLTMTVNDLSGIKNGLDIEAGFVVWQNCGRYVIDTMLVSFSGQVIARVSDPDGNGSPILGSAVVLEETLTGMGHIVAGALPSLTQCISSYYAQFIGTGSSAGGADTLFLSDGTMLVNGDTIPTLVCDTQIYDPPAGGEFQIFPAGFFDNYLSLDVTLNGVSYSPNAYTVSGDTLKFSSIVLGATDELFVRVCSNASSVNAVGNLSQVLTLGNDAGGLRISGLGSPVDSQDAVTLGYLDGRVTVKNDTLVDGDLSVIYSYNGDNLSTLSNPSSGEYTFEVGSGSYVYSITLKGNNTVLTGSQELMFTIDNIANNFLIGNIVQIYDTNNGAYVNQFATGTVHTVNDSGNDKTFTFPGMNNFGSTGYLIKFQ